MKKVSETNTEIIYELDVMNAIKIMFVILFIAILMFLYNPLVLLVQFLLAALFIVFLIEAAYFENKVFTYSATMETGPNGRLRYIIKK